MKKMWIVLSKIFHLLALEALICKQKIKELSTFLYMKQ